MRCTSRWLPVLMGLAGCETMAPGEAGNLVPRTVAEDANLPAIEMNGSRFHFETLGDPQDPAVVFLHGGPGSDYRALLRLADRFQGYSLADDHFLIFWDQRGAGLSMRHDRSVLTLDHYTDDLHELVNRYSPRGPALLIGDSWGGMYATQYINVHPDRVAGAILIEPGPFDGPTFETIEGDLFDLDLGTEWLNDWAWNSQFLSPDDHARMDYERMLGLKDSQPKFHQQTDVDPSPVWRLGAAVNRYLAEDGQNAQGEAVYDFTTNLSRFITPVLFVVGSLSEVLGEDFQRQQMKRYPSASIRVINNAGHDVGWTHAEETVAHIRTYLDSLNGGQIQ